jgi:hypothetical protein
MGADAVPLPVHAARTKLILSFVVAAYGARELRRVIVLMPKYQTPN